MQARTCIAQPIQCLETFGFIDECLLIRGVCLFWHIHIQLCIGFAIPCRHVLWINRQCTLEVDQGLLVALEHLIDLHRRGDAAGEQGLVQPQGLLLVGDVGLEVADVLHLEQQAEEAVAAGGQVGPEGLAEAGEVADGVQEIALGLCEAFEAHLPPGIA